MFIEICPPNSTQHVIEEGDTLWKLSKAYGINIQNILDVNPGINPQNLQIGSTLCIPTAQTMPAPSVKTTLPTKSAQINLPATCPNVALGYTIQSGDTLWKLSQTYGVSIQNILDVNPGINPQNLQIGSTLCMPTAQTVPAPSVKTTPPTKTAPLTPAASLTSEIRPATCPKGTFGYTIQSGDTLWKLSQTYGVSIQNILNVNPGINPQNLQIGSTLCMPTAQTVPAPSVKTTPPTKTAPLTPAASLTSEIRPATCPKGTFGYTIQSGDTLWKLSQTYGVSIQNLLDVNPGINPQNLQIGSTLCIPIAQTVPAPSVKTTPPTKTVPQTPAAPLTSEILPETCPKGTFGYTIQSGDTLWKLSQTYGVSIQNLLDFNPGIDPQNLQIGSTLCIPIAQTVPAPSVKTTPPTKTAPQTPAAPLTSEILPETCPKGTWGYTIQSGDTLWKLSQTYGVNIQNLLDVNPGINPQNLQIGSTLCIPIAQTMPAPSVKTVPLTPVAPLTSEILPATCPKGTWGYTIQSGDTLWKLSQTYGINIQNILDVNPDINPQNLQIGSTLCIPIAQTIPAPSVKTTPPTKTAAQTTAASLRHFAYCIKRCDTICTIARNFYVSVESILNENPGINPKCLQVGTYIYVPVNCCEENTWRYTVMAGETLNGIANKLNVCPSVLIAANPNIDFKHLIHGQVICFPKE